AANAYLAAFVVKRNRLVKEGLRRGAATAIHWPYWQNGGMQIDMQLIEMLRKTTGTLPLKNDEGVKILEHAFHASPEQLCVVTGDRSDIESAICLQACSASCGVVDAQQDVQKTVVSIV